MFRTRLNEALKEAMRAKNPRAVSTLRLILAALTDRDLAEAIALYEQGGRLELAEQEREEIGIIETFLPKQFDDAEVRNVVASVIAEIGATGIKDMGRTMAELRSRYAGQMDFGKASGYVKEVLVKG
jgi:uncharacterized protein YqeY